MKKRKLLAILIPAIFLAPLINAQQNMLLYGLDEAGQSTLSNPAGFTEHRITIGLPVVSGFTSELAISSFSLNDLLEERTEGDSIDLKIDRVAGLLNPENYSSVTFKNDLLFGGIRLNQGYLSFGAYSNFELNMHYPGDLVRMIWKGNSQFYDQTLDFDKINIHLNHYLAYHVGYSHEINEKLRVGARIKYLNGLANISFERFMMRLKQSSDPADYNRFHFRTDITVNTSGMESLENLKPGAYDFSTYLSGKSNPGYALDLGIDYKLNEKLSLSASVVDLGKITWQHDVHNYGSKGEGYFDGITVYTNNDTVDYYNDFIDSLKTVFNFSEQTESYSTNLPARYALSGNYRLNQSAEIGIIAAITSYGGFNEPYIRLSYLQRLSNTFLFRGSYGIMNRTYSNIGLALIANLGPVQFYAAGDNIPGLLFPYDAKMVNFSLGVNIIFQGKSGARPDLAANSD